MWQDAFGGATSASVAIGYGVAGDSGGNLGMVGNFRGSVDFGGGSLLAANNDIFVAKYSSSGDHLWSRGLGGTGNDCAYGASFDGGGNLLVTGYFVATVDFGGGDLTSQGAQDLFVVKYSPSGEHQWSLAPTGSGWATGTGIVAGVNDSVVVTGYFRGTLDFGCGSLSSTGPSDTVVVKYSATGKCLWSRHFGGSGNTRATAVAVNSSGDVAVTGGFDGVTTFGTQVLTSAGSADIFVASYSATGGPQWAQRWGDTGYDYGYGVAFDGVGNVFATGSFQGTVDFGGGPVASLGQFFGADIFLVKYTGAGAYGWVKNFGSGFGEAPAGIAADAMGNIALTGAIVGPVNFGTGFLFGSGDYDVFVATFASNGTNLWSQRRGGNADDRGRGITIDAAGNVIVTGNFPTSIDFGGGLMTTNGNMNAFIVKLTQ